MPLSNKEWKYLQLLEANGFQFLKKNDEDDTFTMIGTKKDKNGDKAVEDFTFQEIESIYNSLKNKEK